MASLSKHFHFRYRAVSPFHILGTCESREFAANSAFTVRARFSQLSKSKELPLRALKLCNLSCFLSPSQQPTTYTIRARFYSPTSFHFFTAHQPLVREVSFFSRSAISYQARPRYLSSLRLLESPSSFLPTKVSLSFSITFTTKIQPKSSSYQPPNISPISKTSLAIDILPATQKYLPVTEAMDSSPDVSDVSTVPTPTSTPGDFKTVLAQYDMTPRTLIEVRDELVSVARAAGDMMLNADSSTCAKSETKNNTSDRVTEIDKAIENMVESRLATRFPGVLFLGEETSGGKQKLTSAPTFVCDPIDGTLNFIQGFPNTAVSLGFTVNKKPVIGVVFNPYRNDMFSAIKGQGAFLTNVTGRTHRLPLRQIPAPMPSLTECMVAIEWGNQREGPNWDLRTSMHKTLMSTKASGGAMCRSTRSFGSAALDFCYVASGNIDMFWEGGCWIWDVCAGWIILEEAGGIVASANPGDWEPTLEGRLYLGVRGAKKMEQAGVVRELWELMGKRKFVF